MRREAGDPPPSWRLLCVSGRTVLTKRGCFFMGYDYAFLAHKGSCLLQADLPFCSEGVLALFFFSLGRRTWLVGSSSCACSTCIEAVFFLLKKVVRDEQYLMGSVFFSSLVIFFSGTD